VVCTADVKQSEIDFWTIIMVMSQWLLFPPPPSGMQAALKLSYGCAIWDLYFNLRQLKYLAKETWWVIAIVEQELVSKDGDPVNRGRNNLVRRALPL